MATTKSMKVLQSMEKNVKEEVEKFNIIQKDLQKCLVSKGKLEGQLIENQNVKDELILLEMDAVVYKMVGPLLVKQDLEEAKQTVGKRMSYISQEVQRYDVKIQDLQKDQDALAEKLMKLQENYQQQVKAGAGAVR